MNRQSTFRWAAALVVAAIAAIAAFVAFAAVSVPGYDTSFALAWGRDLAAGYRLDFAHASSPTPHPLAILGGLAVGVLPVPASIAVTFGFTVAMALALVVLLALLTRSLTGNVLAMAAAVASTAASAAVGLLVLNAASDITYCALGLGAALLTLRSRHVAAIAVFMVAALLRPEAVALALVPLTLALLARRATPKVDAELTRTQGHPVGVFVLGAAAAAATWLAMGAAGGDLLIGLNSAAANADANNNPQGFRIGLSSMLPGLAGVAGWATVIAAAIALTATALTWRGRSAQQRSANAQTAAALPADRDKTETATTFTTGAFIGLAMVTYLAQGLLGTPLVARYLLFPAVLCVAVAARCVPLASRLVRTPSARTAVQAVVALVLVAGSVTANLPMWTDVTKAQQVRTDAFAAAGELLDSDLPHACDSPFVVRSPAMVAVAALKLDRPLADVMIGGEPGSGVLLQPLTVEAAQLAGYGPMTPLELQSMFPTTAPPRQSNAHWALYSACQP